jgi:predicted amidophosphoribosyltransferase
MNDDPYKVCPECGGDYQYTASVCADCEVPLVLPEEVAERDARELPLRPGLILIRTAPILWIRALAADLEQAEIPYAIDRREARSEGLLSLYVHRKDRDEATNLDDARMEIDPLEMDDEPAEDGQEESAPEPEPDYKVCPQCGGEFRLEIERCAECGVDPVKPGEEEGEEDDPGSEEVPEEFLGKEETEEKVPAFPDPPRHEIPASDDLVCLCCGSFSFLSGLSAKLDSADIRHRIERGPYERSSTNACLYLRPEDCDAAERIWDAAIPADEDFADDGRTCPACGTRLPRDASDCPECDLSFEVVPEVTCRHCGAILIGAGKRCPNCGSAVHTR